MTPLATPDDLLGALPESLLLRQLAARWAPDRPAYALGGAVGLFHRFWGQDELVILGPTDGAVALARAAREMHPDLATGFSVPTPAAEQLMKEDGLTEDVRWAFRWTGTAPQAPVEASWLPAGAESEVREVLEAGFPDASMPVGHPDVRRWAGLRRDGRLVAVAADCTITEGVGFVASITSHPDARGTGAGAAVTAFVAAEFVAEHGVCALWHMGDNAVASALYTSLGFHDDDRMTVVGPP